MCFEFLLKHHLHKLEHSWVKNCACFLHRYLSSLAYLGFRLRKLPRYLCRIQFRSSSCKLPSSSSFFILNFCAIPRPILTIAIKKIKNEHVIICNKTCMCRWCWIGLFYWLFLSWFSLWEKIKFFTWNLDQDKIVNRTNPSKGVVKRGPCTCRAKRYVGTFKSRVSKYI